MVGCCDSGLGISLEPGIGFGCGCAVNLGSTVATFLSYWKSGLALLRKEVIQPHLPVQLPCYDLVPVIGSTLGTCLPCGLARRLQVSPTSMT